MYPLHTVIYEVFIYIFSSDWFQTCTIFISGWKDSVFSLFVLKPSYPNLQWPNPWMHSRDCWLVQAENNSPSKTHRAGYHTNRSIWAQQIAGFGCEWPSQIPSLISKKGHTPPTTHTACPLPCSAPAKGNKVGLVSLSLHVWERDEHQRDNQRVEAIHWRLHSSMSWMNGRIGAGWNKKENPSQIIIHGEGIFLSGLLYRCLSQHVTLSICPDKCQSMGLSPGFWETPEDFRDNSQWVHSDGGSETIVTWLHC